MWHRKSYTETRSRKNRHLIAMRNTAERLHHHLLIGTGGTTQKKMNKNSARMISQRINKRKMIPHNNRVRESCLQEKEILVPQIPSPNRVRDSRTQKRRRVSRHNTLYVIILLASPPRAKNPGPRESTSRSKCSAKDVPDSVKNCKKRKTTSA